MLTWSDKQPLSGSQQHLGKARCQIGLGGMNIPLSFYDKITHLVDQGKAADVIFLDFCKAFDMVSHRILLDKMSSIQLNKNIIRWVSLS